MTGSEVARREFMRLMGASLALAGATCTRQPEEKILPYARSPEETIPGQPLYFATAMTLGGYAQGLLVESHEGRPTKVEGNPRHPASLGATDVFAQASVLDLYDPDRARYVTENGRLSRWTLFAAALRQALEEQKPSGGAGLRILTQTITSPTLAQQIEDLIDLYPAAQWHQWEPVNRDNVREGARLAFGSYVHTWYRLDRADLVVALDADFLGGGLAAVRYTRDFMERRRNPKNGHWLVVAEAAPSVSGSVADQRLRLRHGDIYPLALGIAMRLGIVPSRGEVSERAAALAGALEGRRGRSVVIAGERQPPEVHLLAHAINERLGNVGETVVNTDPVEALPVSQLASIRELAVEMEERRVQVLVILGGNPVYDAPADIGFGERMRSVKFRVHLSTHHNETSELAHWHVPEAHYLESWSDARSFDGTASIVQPLIAPLYEGKSAHDVVALLSGSPGSAYDEIRDYWRGRSYFLSYRAGARTPSEEDFERLWNRSLHDGVIEGTGADPVSIPARRDIERVLPESVSRVRGLEMVFCPDPCVWDGRFANNGWLQELPKPLTKLTWDNAASISPATAREFDLETGDVVELAAGGRRVALPVYVQPGHCDRSVSVTLGHGRRGGRVAEGTGQNVYPLRTAGSMWRATDASIRKTGRRRQLAITQEHHRMEGRDLVRVARGGADWPRETPPSLYPETKSTGHAWGMALDLNACTGCNACVMACTAENNVPIVGPQEVRRGREMHWIRVDRYYDGPAEDPETHHQPVMCMHCELAPCEVVCPVGATVHSSEGLNEMVYNRCVGSRYCANNCPYKVRRFNFHQYADLETPVLRMLRNPDVTVRSRGVIEKCTYCVQRIQAARIEARRDGRTIRDGDVAPACQQACPAGAIVFGDLNDPESRVAKLRAGRRRYDLLAGLNTRPRTFYLAKVRRGNGTAGNG